jgi:quercetin dioxygenase-like cupin family protein
MGFKALHYSEVRAEKIEEKGITGVQVRWLITRKDGAPNFAMRFFEVSPNGHSPFHSHKWEHEVFILEGECLVICGAQRRKVGSGSFILIPPDTTHQFKNEGDEVLKFLCFVPHHD